MFALQFTHDHTSVRPRRSFGYIVPQKWETPYNSSWGLLPRRICHAQGSILWGNEKLAVVGDQGELQVALTPYLVLIIEREDLLPVVDHNSVAISI